MRFSTLMARQRQPTGFTLVELMVVLALIGVMTAMIVPEMRGTYSDAVLRAGCRELVSVCSIASSRAVSFNQPHRVRVNAARRTFRVERRIGRQRPGSDAEFVPVHEVPGCEGRLDERITVRLRLSARDPAAEAGESGVGEGADAAGGVEDVMFYPDGTADGVEIQLRDREGFRRTLRVNPVTARVHLLPEKASSP
jgi:type II secretion system protein H